LEEVGVQGSAPPNLQEPLMLRLKFAVDFGKIDVKILKGEYFD